jgi:hypothetical protein
MSPEKLAIFYLRFLGLNFCIYVVLLLTSIPDWLIDLQVSSANARRVAYIHEAIDARLVHDAAYALLGLILIVFARPIGARLVILAREILGAHVDAISK